MKHHPMQNPSPRWLVALALCIAGFSQRGYSAEPLPAEALRQIEVFQAEKAARTPAQKKLDSQLIYGAREARGQALAGVPKFKHTLKLQTDGRVLVDIKAKVTEALLGGIKAGGGEVISSFPALDAIRALVSPMLAEALAGRDEVKFIAPAAEGSTNADQSGDYAHGANLFRPMLNISGTASATGTGVKVGVLSDSVDYLSQAQNSGDLGDVTVLTGQSGTPDGQGHLRSGEGTAMLEIVHSSAPGAQLYFATGFSGAANMATNIRNLQAAGCSIIIDDVTYETEAPFQDDTIARAVNDVSAAGVLYFSAAANSGNLNDGTSGTWEGDFFDGGAATLTGVTGRVHDFAAGAGSTANTLTSFRLSYDYINLFWADPLGAATDDYDLYVTDASGNVLRSSTNTQNGTQDPFEYIPAGGSPAVSAGNRVVIVKVSGAARFLHLGTRSGTLTFATAGATRGHHACGAANAFCVAATAVPTDQFGGYTNTLFTGGTANPVEKFSADGPRRIFFNPDGTPITPGNFSSTGGTVLQKPDITAADNVDISSVPGFTHFPGTSAAAPHAGAIAALLKSFNPSLTNNQIRAMLQSTALDIEAAGWDRDSGYGIVMPYPAFLSVYRWVNFSIGSNGNGAYYTPYNTIANGVAGVPTNGTLLLKFGGTTAETIRITKSLRIQSVNGRAHIGP